MKNQNIILAGFLIALSVGSYLFFLRKKAPNIDTPSNITNEPETSKTGSTSNTASESGKSNPSDIPINTPIVSAEVIKKEASLLAEAKRISFLIYENKKKQKSYKKASSRANIQTVIDTDIAKLLAMGYKPLGNGDVQKI